MFRLKYERAINLSNWSRVLCNYLWICLAAILLTELSIFFIKSFITGFSQSELPLTNYLLIYVIRPTIINNLVLCAASLLIEHFITKEKPAMQALILLIATLIICINLVFVHYVVSTIYAVFCIPILISLLYVDKKPLFFAAASSLISYLCFCFFILPLKPKAAQANQGYMEITSMVALLGVLSILARIVLAGLSDLVDHIIMKTIEVKQDSFTKLLNHASFYEQLNLFIQNHNRKNEEFSLIIWDIDNFKQINDQFGHAIGDHALLCFVYALINCIDENDEAFRYGGEEFTVLTHRNASESEHLAQKIRAEFEERSLSLSLPVTLTVSAGICEFNPDFFLGTHEFFAAADKALYKAKNSPGKNTDFVWHAGVEV
ncbi:GGDEF domain-containing protein [Sporolactobacillus nakayamae]|uniref:Diguanylate cyclase (GGDEF) domain-containing protein n=1 Tax=Sporolactobacillus nakayamae TaxID=269670 RepID=A0A1I2PS81_9BACL|nr:GGDEF domain-containing protein [Sporolactobacillus nakayamae]SFG16867.1 diguanylate cyclase (GGDEF) domain-containing protein [Sporolactobacillus nakayamae]